MSHDPWVVKETRSWLVKADEDLRVCDLCLRQRRPLSPTAAFHAQQASEKTLKAFLTWHARVFRKTHFLVEVGDPCCEIDASLRPVVDRVLPLSDYAWKHRYPGEAIDPSREQALEAVKAAQALFSAIVSRLPADVHPY